LSGVIKPVKFEPDKRQLASIAGVCYKEPLDKFSAENDTTEYKLGFSYILS